MLKIYFYQLATDQRGGIFAKILKSILWFLSHVYGICVRIVRYLYQKDIFKRYALPRAVICVGNLTLGGVGKTPVVEDIALFLKSRNITPVILLRGYMGSVKAEGGSDEARQLQENTGVIVKCGRDRFRRGMEAFNENSADVFLLDDGFQHWRLKRDMDIVLIDASMPFGNGCLIPRGILREPLDALKRASVVLLTKTDFGTKNIENIKRELTRISPDMVIVETIHQPKDVRDIFTHKGYDLSFLNGKTICALCAIGSPGSFEYSLRSIGANIRRMFSFMDHYCYHHEDIHDVMSFCVKEHVDTVVTTSKDAVKLRELIKKNPHNITFLSLQMRIQFVQGEKEFYERISRLCHR